MPIEETVNKAIPKDAGRRALLKAATVAGGAVAASALLPGSWKRPVATIGGLPAHAQTSSFRQVIPSVDISVTNCDGDCGSSVDLGFFATGRYRITYLRGAFVYVSPFPSCSSNEGWTTGNAWGIAPCFGLMSDPSQTTADAPVANLPVRGGTFCTQAEAEADARTYTTPVTFDWGGGNLYLKFYDASDGGNANGSPNNQWEISLIA